MVLGKLKARLGRIGRTANEAASENDDSSERFIGPSPNPMTNLLLADLALRGSSLIAGRAVERALLGRRYAPEKAKKILKGRTMAQTLIGTAIAKVATRSVPGAILVGGGLLAKTLYDRRRGRVAEQKGEVSLDKMAAKGDREEA